MKARRGSIGQTHRDEAQAAFCVEALDCSTLSLRGLGRARRRLIRPLKPCAHLFLAQVAVVVQDKQDSRPSSHWWLTRYFRCRIYSTSFGHLPRSFRPCPARILVEALGASAEKILDRTCMVGIVGPIVTGISELSYFPIGAIERVPVASPTHPLAKLAGEIPSDVLADHVQIVMTDRSALTRGQDFGVLSSMPLRVSDLGAKHQMILAGLGWAACRATLSRRTCAKTVWCGCTQWDRAIRTGCRTCRSTPPIMPRWPSDPPPAGCSSG
jgi:hypothetical protein